MAPVVKSPPANARDIRDVAWALGQEDPLEEGTQPTPVFLPEEAHGQRSLAGYSPWGGRELEMAEQLTFSLSFTSNKTQM